MYRSAITRAQAQRSELVRTAKRAFEGAMTPMMQFLIASEKLSEEDYENLEQLIQNRRRGATDRKR